MSATDLSLSRHDLRASAAGADPLTVKFEGSADFEVQPELDALLGRLHDEALRQGARRVVIDLANLEFMNSSCFKSFLSWIARVRDLEKAKQYHLSFVSDERRHWQKRSLHAMRCFAADLISIDPSPSA